jgi:hypothetical protein
VGTAPQSERPLFSSLEGQTWGHTSRRTFLTGSSCPSLAISGSLPIASLEAQEGKQTQKHRCHTKTQMPSVRVQMVKIVTTPKHWLLISTCRYVCIANSKTCASLTSITRHLHWLDELCL